MKSIYRKGIVSWIIVCFHAVVSGQNMNISNSVMNLPAGAYCVGGGIIIQNAAAIDNSGTIDLTGNWTNNAGGLINGSAGTVNLEGSTNQTIGGSASTTFHNLSLNNAAGATLTSPTLTVNGVLKLENGKLNAGSNNTVIVGTTGAVNRIAGWVVGSMTKPVSTGNPTVTFEHGNTNYYFPTTLAFSGVTTPGNYNIKVIAGLHPNIGATCTPNATKRVNEYWTITNTNVSPANYTATFKYNATLFTGSPNPAGFIVGKYSNSNWTFPTVSGIPNTTTTAASGISGSGDFIIAEATGVPANDEPGGAQLLPVSATITSYAFGSPVTGTLCGATNSVLSVAPFTNGGEDVWYKFVATEPGIRLEVSSAYSEVSIELQSAPGTPINTENLLATTGTEILNYAGLTVGNTYYVSVQNHNSSLGVGTFTIAAKPIPSSACVLTASGIYDLCGLFKAKYLSGVSSYKFEFSPDNFSTIYTITQTSNLLPLYSILNVPGLNPYAHNYSVRITANWVLSNATGTDVLQIPMASPCTVTLTPQPLTEVRSLDRCSSTSLSIYSWLKSAPFICGATDYKWEFTEVPGGLPFTKYRGMASNQIKLNTVAGLQLGKTYKVRIAPVFGGLGGAGGAVGIYGPYQNICILGPGMVLQNDGENTVRNTFEETTEEFALASIYPNPNAGDQLILNYKPNDHSTSVDVRLIDALGRKLVNKHYSFEGSLNTILDLNNVVSANGIYMVEFISSSGIITRRLIIEK